MGDFIETRSFFKEPQNLADRLTEAGIELDFFEDQKALFDKFVVAQILSVKKHPQADRLTLCELITHPDQDKTLQVVCGAKNHKAGDKVVLAQVGAVLPQGLKIKKSRIRGEMSEGMLASREELGLLDTKDETEGIWILPESATLGENLASYKKWDDILFEVAVPPNRSDCLSHKGLAREISSLFSLDFKTSESPSSLTVKENHASRKSSSNKESHFKEENLASQTNHLAFSNQQENLAGQTTLSNKERVLNSKSYFSIEVQDKVACPRYCACFIEGVEIRQSPEWLKKRLNSVGLKSINNVVDVTNFILWDQGQPLHAFDRDKIQNLKIGPAKENEKLVTLDGQELELSLEDLTIRDKKGAVALAGIMGGSHSGITEQTKNIMIEAAYFAPERIRKSSRRFGLETDSSYRFSRGVDPQAVFFAMEKASLLIQQLAGGTLSKNFYDLNEIPEEKHPITISLEELSSRLGYKVEADDFVKHTIGIFCKLELLEEAVYQVSPPSHRSDLRIKEDLMEEFARLQGYDKIPENPPPVFFQNIESDKTFLKLQKWTHWLSSRSWLQSLHYSFCDPEYYKDFLKSQFYLEELLEGIKTKESKESFVVNNPISQKLSLMKPLLTPDLFKTLLKNFRQNNKQGQVFELSPIFYHQSGNYHQNWHLALALWGEPLDLWSSRLVPNFYKMKGELETLFEVAGLKAAFKTADLNNNQLPFLHPKKTLILNYQKTKIGFLGVLHPTVAEHYKIPVEVVLAELDLSFLKHQKEKASHFKSFSELLTVEKDLCFVIPEAIAVQEVKEEIQKTLSAISEGVFVFDIYKKDEQRFVSFRLRLSPDKKSWTDEELQSFLQKVIQSLGKKFSIQLKA